MSSYEQKQAARRARYEACAEKARRESDAIFDKASAMASEIPFGQPILIGHHSEKRDRNYRDRIYNTFGKSVSLQEKAEYYEEKAAVVGTAGISSDDPNAIEALRADLAEAEARQERMKATNRALRGRDYAALSKLGFSTDEIEGHYNPDKRDKWGRRIRLGFPIYELSNNSARARRIKQRIRQLESLKAYVGEERAGEGYFYREDSAENRVMFTFPDKPDPETRALLKRHHFKWSPSRGAWVRQRTVAGIYAGREVYTALDSKAVSQAMNR